jgi:hypothetical protein
MRSRSTVQVLWAGLAISALAGGISKIIEFVHPGVPSTLFASGLYRPLYLIADTLAFLYCRRIWLDLRRPSRMRTAWVLIGASSAASIARHAFEWATFLLGWHNHANPMEATVVSLRQIPTVTAMLLLTAGLIFMWSAFAAIGLGQRFRLRDVALPLVIVGLVAAVFPNRQELWDDRSVYPIIRYMQWSSPVTLALPALIGLALQRIGEEMDGGQFAGSLRLLVWSLLLRLASLLTTFSPALKGIEVVAIAGTAAFWGAPWLFALAVVRRWRITESLHELGDLYEKDPEQELAKLAVPSAFS